MTFSWKPNVNLLFNFIKLILYQSNAFSSSEMMQGMLTFTKLKTVKKKKNGCTGLLSVYVKKVYALQFMDILDSIFGADRGTSEDEEKTKGDAKKDEAAGMYITCLF